MLIEQAHKGDKTAREQLVEENLGLVYAVVKRFLGRGCEMEDLVQIGSIGLLKAIDKFDQSYDVKFSTYAVPLIAGEIKRFLRDDGMIKVSRSVKELGMKVRSMREQLTNEHGREPSLDEIARCLGVSREEAAASLEAGAEVESIYKTVNTGDDQNLCLLDKIPDEREEQEQLMNQMVLKQLLDTLDEKEKEIITRRYFENQTQSQIAADLHISQVQVSRLERKILLKMREYLNS